MAHRRTFLLPLFVCLFAANIQADDQPGKHLPGWGELSNPDGDCEISVTKDKVKITVPGKAHDFAAELKRWNSPHILAPVAGDSIIEVNRPYHGAGLLLVKDRDNYVGLHRGAVYLDNGIRHYANLELRKDGELSISRYELGIDDQDTYLRVERRGYKFYALASHDGVHWKTYAEPITVDFPAELRVGVVAVSSSDQPLRCSFEGFGVFRKQTEKAGLR
jgi:hypothetical protein